MTKRKRPEDLQKNGAKTKYRKEYDKRVFKLGLLGLTEVQLAAAFDIDESTLTRWKSTYPSFRTSLKESRVDADGNVAMSLYQKALGAEHPEDKIFCDSKSGEVTIVPTTKRYPPDTAAAFIWLKNRAGWRDRVENDSNPQDRNTGVLNVGPNEVSLEDWLSGSGGEVKEEE